MTESAQNITVYLEIGQKKTVAGALDWPGWCRIGKNREAALQVLALYSRRYAQVMALGGLPFPGAVDLSHLQVIEELAGTGTTDYGVPVWRPSRINGCSIRKAWTGCWRSCRPAGRLSMPPSEPQKGRRCAADRAAAGGI